VCKGEVRACFKVSKKTKRAQAGRVFSGRRIGNPKRDGEKKVLQALSTKKKNEVGAGGEEGMGEAMKTRRSARYRCSHPSRRQSAGP